MDNRSAHYAFLHLDGIEGSATDSEYEKHLPIHHASWGVVNHGNFGHGTGGSTHRGQISELTISKVMCKATPTLFQHCTTGKHIAEGTLHLTWQSGDTKKSYLTKKMKHILVTSHQISASGDAQHPIESLTLQFVEMEKTYIPQDNEGSAGGGVRFGYNLQKQQTT